MAKNSKIEWTDHTWNPWLGCTKVSPGCTHCYAEEMMDHRFGKVKWGPQGTRVVTSDANWRQPVKWNREAKRDGIRRKVFCASLADVFEDRPELAQPRQRLFRLIRDTEYLDWLVLTKRPENIDRLLQAVHEPFIVHDSTAGPRQERWTTWTEIGVGFDRLWPNLWLGVSVEDQARADERIPLLLIVPAKVRFLSVEPLLGPVDLSQWLSEHDDRCDPARVCSGCNEDRGLLGWVIVGSESGSHARPCKLAWVRSLRDQCQDAGVPFFFKQHTVNGRTISLPELDGKRWAEAPTPS